MGTWKEVVVGLEGADYVQLEDGNLCDKRRWVASEVVRSSDCQLISSGQLYWIDPALAVTDCELLLASKLIAENLGLFAICVDLLLIITISAFNVKLGGRLAHQEGIKLDTGIDIFGIVNLKLEFQMLISVVLVQQLIAPISIFGGRGRTPDGVRIDPG